MRKRPSKHEKQERIFFKWAGVTKTDLTETELKFGDWTQQVQDSLQMRYIVRMVNDLRFQYE